MGFWGKWFSLRLTGGQGDAMAKQSRSLEVGFCHSREVIAPSQVAESAEPQNRPRRPRAGAWPGRLLRESYRGAKIDGSGSRGRAALSHGRRRRVGHEELTSWSGRSQAQTGCRGHHKRREGGQVTVAPANHGRDESQELQHKTPSQSPHTTGQTLVRAGRHGRVSPGILRSWTRRAEVQLSQKRQSRRL